MVEKAFRPNPYDSYLKKLMGNPNLVPLTPQIAVELGWLYGLTPSSKAINYLKQTRTNTLEIISEHVKHSQGVKKEGKNPLKIAEKDWEHLLTTFARSAVFAQLGLPGHHAIEKDRLFPDGTTVDEFNRKVEEIILEINSPL